nr:MULTISPECIES: ABC transporter ATP-binding protein [Clostridia]
MNVQSVIRVRNLYKLYHLGEETVRALDGVDFEIQKGEFCAIVGTSGSGKSTLLNMLAGLEKPTKGEVVISGCHLERMNEEQLVSFRRRRVGFIFQAYQLIASMDAEENVALPLSFRGMKKSERTLRARRMLDRVMLGKYRKHFPNQMSGGQQQRVGVARALVSDPEIIFADEPTGNLDSRTSREIMSLMQKVVREQGCTLVMVTHDPQLASWADRIIKVIDGKIVSIEVKKKESTEDEEMV